MSVNESSFRQGKDLEVGLLLDFYGELLSASKRESAELYFNEDLSLAEIAENTGITRQGVRDSIEKAKAQLYSYEEKLGLLRRFTEVQTHAARAIALCEEAGEPVSDELRREIHRLAELVSMK